MQKIERILGIAAPLMVDNISTDIISPSSLLRTVNADLAAGLFGPWRYVGGEHDNPDFVLNRRRYRGASVLVAGRNFGCGSSREHAVWCLLRYGIRCVIAPSFGEIFYESSFKNGLVALVLPEEDVDGLAKELDAAAEPRVGVDIRALTLTSPSGRAQPFKLDPSRREALIEGLEEIDLMLRQEAKIAAFQADAKRARPWLYPSSAFTADRLRETS
jgi:3-isopropylmalate/(R)-2-methylmalate dehydratase small subunit